MTTQLEQDMNICKYNQDPSTCPKDPMNCQCLLDATMTTQLEHLIDAAEARAEKYNGDDRQHIKTDVMNAFYAGAKWQSENLEQEPVAEVIGYGNDSWERELIFLVDRLSLPIGTKLYTSPPNTASLVKAAEAAALMKAVRALEANEQFYARDTIQSLIDAAPTREDE